MLLCYLVKFTRINKYLSSQIKDPHSLSTNQTMSQKYLSVMLLQAIVYILKRRFDQKCAVILKFAVILFCWCILSKCTECKLKACCPAVFVSTYIAQLSVLPIFRQSQNTPAQSPFFFLQPYKHISSKSNNISQHRIV